ncbi:helix-turn-helix transcriptional regulator [Fulvivirga sp. M361]|nr:helix-turn-helix transcriptional regulator [Fulvivirga sp. M361]
MTTAKLCMAHNMNLVVIDKWLAEERWSLEEVGSTIPAVFHLDAPNLVPLYLNYFGRNSYDLSNAELQVIGEDFHKLYIHSNTLQNVFPRVKQFFERKDFSDIFCEMVKIWYPLEKEYKLCLLTTKLSRINDGLVSITQPIEEIEGLAVKTQRLLREERFVVSNYHRFNHLTDREKQIIGLLANGMNGPAIANQLFLSKHTVQQHRKNINRKLGIHSFVELLKYAQAFGVV